MAWKITVDGSTVSSDDFLIGDLIEIEQRTKGMWSTLNPWRDAGHAKEFLRVALIRSGVDPEDAQARAESLTLRELKTAFEFEEDAKAPAGKDQPAPKKKARTARSSSPGAQGSSDGPRSKPGDSD